MLLLTNLLEILHDFNSALEGAYPTNIKSFPIFLDPICFNHSLFLNVQETFLHSFIFTDVSFFKNPSSSTLEKIFLNFTISTNFDFLNYFCLVQY